MAGEECEICGDTILFSHAIHVMINPRDVEGVVDFYVCESCFKESLKPLYAPDEEQ